LLEAAVVTQSAVEEMGPTAGAPVTTLVKASVVMLAKVV
jgi:molybdopterin-binding protein